MNKHLHITVNGHLEKAGYRFRTFITAKQLNIKGYVAETSGMLTIEAEGEEAKLDLFVHFCESIPASVLPLVIEIKEKPMMFYDDFRIL